MNENRANNIIPGDDSDMKIVGSETDNVQQGASEAELLQKYDSLRRSGELSQARRLGASLAGGINSIYDALHLMADDEQVTLHSRLLIIFATVAAIEARMPERMLSRAVLNAFYDTLKKDAPELYDSMSVTGAVTFYYLEYRRLGDMPADIGGTFAMLCGREDEVGIIELGGYIFSRSFDHVSRIIDNMAFGS